MPQRPQRRPQRRNPLFGLGQQRRQPAQTQRARPTARLQMPAQRQPQRARQNRGSLEGILSGLLPNNRRQQVNARQRGGVSLARTNPFFANPAERAISERSKEVMKKGSEHGLSEAAQKFMNPVANSEIKTGEKMKVKARQLVAESTEEQRALSKFFDLAFEDKESRELWKKIERKAFPLPERPNATLAEVKLQLLQFMAEGEIRSFNDLQEIMFGNALVKTPREYNELLKTMFTDKERKDMEYVFKLFKQPNEPNVVSRRAA